MFRNLVSYRKDRLILIVIKLISAVFIQLEMLFKINIKYIKYQIIVNERYSFPNQIFSYFYLGGRGPCENRCDRYLKYKLQHNSVDNSDNTFVFGSNKIYKELLLCGRHFYNTFEQNLFSKMGVFLLLDIGICRRVIYIFIVIQIYS